jgi:arsenite-transporting ATPase
VNNVLDLSLKDGKVYPAGLELRDCEFCRERSNAQEEYIKQIRRKFSNLKTTIIPLQPREVKGIGSLDNFSRLLLP